jgi:hypothetical protein
MCACFDGILSVIKEGTGGMFIMRFILLNDCT